jgi:hypothetical protein
MLMRTTRDWMRVGRTDTSRRGCARNGEVASFESACRSPSSCALVRRHADEVQFKPRSGSRVHRLPDETRRASLSPTRTAASSLTPSHAGPGAVESKVSSGRAVIGRTPIRTSRSFFHTSFRSACRCRFASEKALAHSSCLFRSSLSGFRLSQRDCAFHFDLELGDRFI